MGRKKAVGSTEGQDKTRVELRFDPEVYDGIKRLADTAQISVNQLMQGLARWAATKLIPNKEPVRGEGGFVTVRDQPGCLWAGKVGTMRRMTSDEIAREEEDNGPVREEDAYVVDQVGVICLSLDFTERRVVREDGDRT